MRLLDLCCGGGGASMGYHLAGWEVVGVDIVHQPDYPFEFHRADGLEYLAEQGRHFDAVHASPPCQASSTLTKGTNAGDHVHTDQVGAYRREIRATGLPYVIENVVTAQIRPDLTLCGLMFGLTVLRHRWFEASFGIPQPKHPAHVGRVKGWRHGVVVKGTYTGVWGHGGYKGTRADWKEAMGIDWMSKKTMTQAIPPAYTQFIGTEMAEVLK